jgi:hypothetical protein
MELSAYIRNCIRLRAFPTHYSLTFSHGDLLTAFRGLRDVSEAEGLEYGFKMNLDAHDRLVPGTRIRGSEQTVELRTREWRTEPTYIGDCHTHPYRLKMGADAEIGPSSGDYMEWWTYPPENSRVAVHFVISVDRVFLIVSRIKTITRLTYTRKDESATLRRYTAANEKLAMAAFDDYPRLTYTEKLRARKGAWDSHAPKAAKEFAQENLAYNLDMARILRFEFYAGRLGSGREACNLQLLSSRLYGSCCDYLKQLISA